MIARRKKIRRNVYKQGIRQRRHARVARVRRAALIVGGLVFFLVFNVALILAHDWLTQTTLLPIEAVQVEGVHRLGADRVRQQAGIAPGANIMAVNLDQAQKRLEAHPWIAAAQVVREIPDRIRIRIQEHECRAVLNLDRQFLISAEGTVFKQRQGNECQAVPLISGIDYADLGIAGRPCAPSLAAALAFLNHRSAAAFGKGNPIREIRVDPDLGLTLFVQARGTPRSYRTVILGFTSWQQTYRKYSVVQSYLGQRDLMPNAQIFNLRDLNRIVISPEAQAPSTGPAAKEV
jgi:cell division protein FtsQ